MTMLVTFNVDNVEVLRLRSLCCSCWQAHGYISAEDFFELAEAPRTLDSALHVPAAVGAV